MTSHEIVRKAITMRSPPRLPVTMGCFGVDDTAWIGYRAAEGWTPKCPGADEWGCVWEKTNVENMGQVKGHPLRRIQPVVAGGIWRGAPLAPRQGRPLRE